MPDSAVDTLTEHVDANGLLRVPVQRAEQRTPPREGWKPFYVSTNMAGWDRWEGKPQKIVTYRRAKP